MVNGNGALLIHGLKRRIFQVGKSGSKGEGLSICYYYILLGLYITYEHYRDSPNKIINKSTIQYNGWTLSLANSIGNCCSEVIYNIYD